MKRGIEIHSIVSGFLTMMSPLKVNSRTRVISNAVMLIGVKYFKNLSLNQAWPFLLIIHIRE